MLAVVQSNAIKRCGCVGFRIACFELWKADLTVMLETLHIHDYAIIEDLHIEFRPGFNVLTGETGAGKSIVVGALGLALGARASGDAIRSGAQKASVEVVVHLDPVPPELMLLLEELDIPLEDNRLILSRTIAADGRNRALANGRVIPVATLASIGDELVDLHGQHEHQSLLRPECQMRLLDAYAGAEETRSEVAEAVAKWRRLEADIARLETDDRDRARQADFLRHELDEIDKAALVSGEEEELRERLHLITNAETIHRLASCAYAALYESEEKSAVDALAEALKNLEELERIDLSFKEQATQAGELRASVEVLASELRGFTSRMEFDPEEIDTLNARLSLISSLKRKYGADIDAILEYRDKAAVSLADYENRDARLESLRAERERILAFATEKAAVLSAARREAAAHMDRKALEALQSLDMPKACFETVLEPVKLGGHGMDKITFMLSANAGEPMKPLRQVASGGEISRVMLALKTVFAAQDTVPTLVFDEIDAGIGGATARRVAETLAGLSDRRQVLCITHLAQIAAMAAAHFVVLKQEDRNITVTNVNEISGSEREKEIARLLDGSVSGASLEHAKVLLAESCSQ